MVVIMIGNELGREISSMVHAGEEVFLNIELGNPHGPWSNPIWIYMVTFTLFSVTTVTMAYFTILSVKRVHRHLMLRREEVSQPRRRCGDGDGDGADWEPAGSVHMLGKTVGHK